VRTLGKTIRTTNRALPESDAIRHATFPWTALLDQPDFPTIVVTGFDNSHGKNRINVLSLVPDRFTEPCLGAGIGPQRNPRDGVRLVPAAHLVTDAYQDGNTGSSIIARNNKFFPISTKKVSID